MPTVFSPSQFVQSVRQRRRVLKPEESIVIVEGIHDRRCLLPFLTDSTVVLVANSKEVVIWTYENLETDLRDGVLFIMDCDGHVQDHLKGRTDLVITTNRDIEADLLFELNAMNRLASELIEAEVAMAAREVAAEALAVACKMSGMHGAVLHAAKSVGAPIRINDRSTRQSRPIRVSDLDECDGWASDTSLLTGHSIVVSIGGKLSWDGAQLVAIEGALRSSSAKRCRSHASAECEPCFHRSFCDGHALVDSLAVVLRARCGARISAAELDRLMRVSSDASQLSGWEVANRIRQWEAFGGRSVLSR